MKRSIATLLLFAAFSLSLWAQTPAAAGNPAAIPNVVRFGGTLPSASGSSASIIFALYADQTGGAPLWQEVQSVTVDASGRYNVLLGSTTTGGVPVDLFSTNEARWLGLAVQGASEQPRVLLVSVPYALKAADAETLGGLPVSAFALAGSVNGGGTTSATATNYVNSAAVTAAAVHAATTITGVAQNYLPYVSDGSGTLSQSTMSEAPGTGNLGVNNQSPAVPLHVGSAAANGTQIEAEGANASFSVVNHGTAPNSANFTFVTASNGTLAGDELGQLGGIGSLPGGALGGSTSVKEVFTAAATFAPGSTPGEILWYTTPIGSTSHHQRMILDPNGNLGIGTAAPGAPLEVYGNIKLSSGSAGSITFPDATVQTTAYTGGSGQQTIIAPVSVAPGTNALSVTTSAAASTTTGQGSSAIIGTSTAADGSGIGVSGIGVNGSTGLYGTSDTGLGLVVSSPIPNTFPGALITGLIENGSEQIAASPTTACSPTTGCIPSQSITPVPYSGLVLRRIQSLPVSVSPNPVVAYSFVDNSNPSAPAGVSVQRDPTGANNDEFYLVSDATITGGIPISYACYGATSTNKTVAYTGSFVTPGSTITTSAGSFSGATMLPIGNQFLSFHCVFGRIDDGGNMTELTLSRYNASTGVWVGTIISDSNQ